MNSIGEALRKEENIKVFKAGLKKWVIENIPIKPKTKFQKFQDRLQPRTRSPVPVQNNTQDIRNFMVDRTAGTDSTGSAPPLTPTDRPPPSSRPTPTAPGNLQIVEDIRTHDYINRDLN